MSDEAKAIGCATVMVVVLIILGIVVWQVRIGKVSEELAVVFSGARGFWDGEVRRSDNGYLLTQEYIPLRAIARRPNVPLFGNLDWPGDSFREVMQPWRPYYVYEYDAKRGALRVAEKARLEAEALWVLETDVYCWTTRETLNIEEPTPVYASLDDAKAGIHPVVEDYTFTYEGHFEKRGRNGRRHLPIMAALPVLRREEGEYWSFIRPDPEPLEEVDRPYQVRWLRWDGEDSGVTVRLRVTRPEFEDWTNKAHQLLFEYRYGSPDEKTTARRGLVAEGQATLTGEEEVGDVRRYSNTVLETRNEGIPVVFRYLNRRIQDDLQYENVKKRFAGILKIGNDLTVWDADEIAYLDMLRMP